MFIVLGVITLDWVDTMGMKTLVFLVESVCFSVIVFRTVCGHSVAQQCIASLIT